MIEDLVEGCRVDAADLSLTRRPRVITDRRHVSHPYTSTASSSVHHSDLSSRGAEERRSGLVPRTDRRLLTDDQRRL